MFHLQAIVDDPLMRHSAVLVFANKQDLVGLLHSVGQDAPDAFACTLQSLYSQGTMAEPALASCIRPLLLFESPRPLFLS